MSQPITFAHAAFAAKQKPPRREVLLARRDEVIPRAKRLAVIAPFYPKGERGRPPGGLERRRRGYFLQPGYDLAAEALADARYDRQARQQFARLDLAGGGVPDAPTRWDFRHLLEAHDLCQGRFAAINADLAARGLRNHAEHADREFVQQQQVKLEAHFAKQMAAVEAEMRAALERAPQWQAPVAKLEALAGVGRRTAVSVLSQMPELGHLNRGEAAALAGLAQWTRQSGPWEGQRHLGGGRAAVPVRSLCRPWAWPG